MKVAVRYMEMPMLQSVEVEVAGDKLTLRELRTALQRATGLEPGCQKIMLRDRGLRTAQRNSDVSHMTEASPGIVLQRQPKQELIEEEGPTADKRNADPPGLLELAWPKEENKDTEKSDEGMLITLVLNNVVTHTPLSHFGIVPGRSTYSDLKGELMILFMRSDLEADAPSADAQLKPVKIVINGATTIGEDSNHHVIPKDLKSILGMPDLTGGKATESKKKKKKKKKKKRKRTSAATSQLSKEKWEHKRAFKQNKSAVSLFLMLTSALTEEQIETAHLRDRGVTNADGDTHITEEQWKLFQKYPTMGDAMGFAVHTMGLYSGIACGVAGLFICIAGGVVETLSIAPKAILFAAGKLISILGGFLMVWAATATLSTVIHGQSQGDRHKDLAEYRQYNQLLYGAVVFFNFIWLGSLGADMHAHYYSLSRGILGLFCLALVALHYLHWFTVSQGELAAMLLRRGGLCQEIDIDADENAAEEEKNGKEQEPEPEKEAKEDEKEESEQAKAEAEAGPSVKWARGDGDGADDKKENDNDNDDGANGDSADAHIPRHLRTRYRWLNYVWPEAAQALEDGDALPPLPPWMSMYDALAVACCMVDNQTVVGLLGESLGILPQYNWVLKVDRRLRERIEWLEKEHGPKSRSMTSLILSSSPVGEEEKKEAEVVEVLDHIPPGYVARGVVIDVEREQKEEEKKEQAEEQAEEEEEEEEEDPRLVEVKGSIRRIRFPEWRKVVMKLQPLQAFASAQQNSFMAALLVALLGGILRSFAWNQDVSIGFSPQLCSAIGILFSVAGGLYIMHWLTMALVLTLPVARYSLGGDDEPFFAGTERDFLAHYMAQTHAFQSAEMVSLWFNGLWTVCYGVKLAISESGEREEEWYDRNPGLSPNDSQYEVVKAVGILIYLLGFAMWWRFMCVPFVHIRVAHTVIECSRTLVAAEARNNNGDADGNAAGAVAEVNAAGADNNNNNNNAAAAAAAAVEESQPGFSSQQVSPVALTPSRSRSRRRGRRRRRKRGALRERRAWEEPPWYSWAGHERFLERCLLWMAVTGPNDDESAGSLVVIAYMLGVMFIETCIFVILIVLCVDSGGGHWLGYINLIAGLSLLVQFLAVLWMPIAYLYTDSGQELVNTLDTALTEINRLGRDSVMSFLERDNYWVLHPAADVAALGAVNMLG